MDMLNIALPKGRLGEKVYRRFKAAGYPCPSIEEENRKLIETVKRLPEKYRVVIHLFYYEEMSVEEIGKATGSRASTVRTRLTRARRILKDQLGGL